MDLCLRAGHRYFLHLLKTWACMELLIYNGSKTKKLIFYKSYSGVFSQASQRTRYKGIAKNQFTAFMEAICFNLKRLLVLSPPHLEEVMG